MRHDQRPLSEDHIGIPNSELLRRVAGYMSV